jgi:hypothetical protein
MSTLKSINIIHPSGSTNNIVNDASGNVGIGNNLGVGTTTPAASVSVTKQTTTLSGTGNAYGLYMYPTSSGLAYIDAVTSTSGNTSLGFRTYNNGTYNDAVRIDNSGNVGIGTTSPSTTLQVSKGAAGTSYAIYVDNAAGGGGTNVAGIGFSNGGVLKSSITSAVFNNDWMAFNVGGSGTTERARIDSSGNFYVSGSGSNTSGTGWAGALTNPVGSISIARNGSNVLAFFHTSNAGGIGGSPVGTISITTTATTYSTSSDYRLKNSVVPMTTGLSTVSALKPVTYKWNADNSDGEGFIAHELQEVVPLAVTGSKDAVDEDGKPIHQGVDYSKIVVHLVAAIQELKVQNDELKAKNDAFEARLAALEAK